MLSMICDNLFPIVLNMSLTGGGVILFVLLAREVLKGAPKVFSYALWAVVLFRLLCPVSVNSGFSLLQIIQPPIEERTPFTSSVTYVKPDRNLAEITEITETAQPVAPLAPVSEKKEAVQPIWENESVSPWALLWLAGIMGMLIYSAVSLLQLRKKLIGAIPLQKNIYLADHIASPFVMGILRPRIYLPSSLSERELNYILLHEQYHIRRGDHLIKVLAFAALSIHWFNPLVWIAFIMAGKDMEMSCDEAVLRRLGEEVRCDYSASLLSLATGRRIIAGMPLAFGEGDPKGRIQNMMRWKKPNRKIILGAALLCALAILACACNPQAAKKGQYKSMDDFAEQTLASIRSSEVTYAEQGSGGQFQNVSAKVLDAKVADMHRAGTVSNLAPEGVLEVWTLSTLVKIDADPEKVMLVGGMYEEDGWFDLEGQGGHILVTLRYPDDSLDVLYDEPANDYMNFYGLHSNVEDALYDWYVKEKKLDLPLYVEDWQDQLNTAHPEDLGAYPVHRYDGDGWYCYIPETWTVVEPSEMDRGKQWKWISSYPTDSDMTVLRSTQSIQDNEITAKKQGYHPVDEAKHIWERIKDGWTSRYCLFENPDGGSWRVEIRWNESKTTGYPYTAMEPDVLRLMAEHFTVDDRFTWVDTTALEQGINGILVGGYSWDETIKTADTCTLTAVEKKEKPRIYTLDLPDSYNIENTPGRRLVSDFSWTMAPVDSTAGNNRYSFRFENENGVLTVYSDENRLELEVDGVRTVWLCSARSFGSYGNTSELFTVFRSYAEKAEYAHIKDNCTVSKEETDYAVIAEKLAQQYAESILQRPDWYVQQAEDVRLVETEVFDAYYGEDHPNFCFTIELALKLNAEQTRYWEAGSGLDDPLPDGPNAGYYRWARQVSAEQGTDGVWHIGDFATGGASVALPVAMHEATIQELFQCYFLTEGFSHDWLLYELSQRPLEQVTRGMEALPEMQHQQLRAGILQMIQDNPNQTGWRAEDFK